MAKRSASFLDLHAEKIALGLCGVLLMAAAVYSFGGMRFRVGGRSPAELAEEATKQAEQTARSVASAQLPKSAPLPGANQEESVKRLSEWFGGGAESLIKLAEIQPNLGRTQKFPPPLPWAAGVSREDRKDLASIVAPGVPVVMTDQATLEIAAARDLQNPAAPGNTPTAAKSSSRSYVSVAAQVDLFEQEADFNLAGYPPGSYLSIVKVRLQRKDEDEPWRGWQDVDTYSPMKLPEPPALLVDGQYRLDGLTAFKRSVDAASQEIARPELPGRRAASALLPYLDEPPDKGGASDSGQGSRSEEKASKRVRDWMDRAKKALAGKKPFSEPDVDAACILARAAAAETGASEKDTKAAAELLREIVAKLPKSRQEWAGRPLRAAERLMPLLAHDLSPIPGHRYTYRMRYEVLNLYAGNPRELKDPKDAGLLTLRSDWSPPSRHVTVKSDHLFFMTQADPDKLEVSVTIYKKTRMGWKDQDYKIKVGDAIGEKEKKGKNKDTDFSTGLVCVDIDFKRLDPAPGGKMTATLVYVDPSDGRLHERYLSKDRKDKDQILKRLMEPATAMR